MFRTDKPLDADRIETTTDLGRTGDVTDILLDVVRAVAAETDRGPLEMEPVYDALDPDTIARLADRRRGADSTAADPPVRLRYGSCDVTVAADGSVSASLRRDEMT
ncbi:HalOD1 output domain-containing protein [Halosimplex pelagicum]|uniref:Halobacterial output domain-containing protein n=1 Tax=Halosimplex pelagicum TaxID=869886 RepID=A0A7D5TDE7_9EURY|nr:HalOD1 output domain-containing protein [Halosimplex pelagicum]QLH82975.1 hypothetical protein HZS54_15675 [Halosimplex pelagicum]